MRPHPRPPPRLLLFGISSSTLAPCHFFGCPACAGQGAAKGLVFSSVQSRNIRGKKCRGIVLAMPRWKSLVQAQQPIQTGLHLFLRVLFTVKPGETKPFEDPNPILRQPKPPKSHPTLTRAPRTRQLRGLDPVAEELLLKVHGGHLNGTWARQRLRLGALFALSKGRPNHRFWGTPALKTTQIWPMSSCGILFHPPEETSALSQMRRVFFSYFWVART